ncbi:MAG: putative transposase [Eubacteriales bacterium]|nr:putative transposase [Eubacteriales bacterium]MDN5364073.1 putative transposase [Eubacteriales bacterium]
MFLRPGVEYERVRELSITYDKDSGQLQVRLVVEVKERSSPGPGKAAVDLGRPFSWPVLLAIGKFPFILAGS